MLCRLPAGSPSVVCSTMGDISPLLICACSSDAWLNFCSCGRHITPADTAVDGCFYIALEKPLEKPEVNLKRGRIMHEFTIQFAGCGIE